MSWRGEKVEVFVLPREEGVAAQGIHGDISHVVSQATPMN